MATAINAELHNDDMMVVQATLTSDSSGDAAVTTSHSYKGFIVQVEIDPDDSDTPTDNWDLFINDTYARVADISNNDTGDDTVADIKYQDDLHNGIACYGPLTITGDAMGSGKTAVVTIYIIRIM